MTVGITELPPEGMQLPGVALAGDAERGTKTTEGISLLFTASGVTVQGPQPQIERLLVWSALDSATCREKLHLADGRQAAILELTSGGQSIRFLLPNDTVSPGQAAYLDQALPAWLQRYKGVAGAVPSAPVAPGPAAPRPEVGVDLPAPGLHADAAATSAPTPAPDASPVYAAATAGAVAAAHAGDPMHAGDRMIDPSHTNGSVAPVDGQAPGLPVMQASSPSAPTLPAPGVAAPGMQAPPPPPPPAAPAAPPAPAAPAMTPPGPAPEPAAPFFQAPSAPSAPVAPAPTAWDEPPLGLAAPVAAAAEAPKAKKPKFALTRKQLNAAKAAAADADADADVAAAPAPTVDQGAVPAATFEGPKPKKPKFALTRKQLNAAQAAAATSVVGATVEPTVTAPAAAAPVAEAPKAKKPKFALTRKQLHAAEAAAAATAVAGASTVGAAPTAAAQPSAPTAPSFAAAPVTASAPKAKKPKFALTRKQLHAAEAAAVGTVSATTVAPPTAPPSAPVPLAVQPPPPAEPATSVAGPVAPAGQVPPTGGPVPPGLPSAGGPGAGGVALASAESKPNRRNLVLLVVLLLVVVAAGAGYLISKKSSTTPVATPVVVSPAVTNTVLAASINLRLSDLPAGWTVAPPAQAVVRPPVATAVAQAGAVNVMASCLGTSYAVVSGLFDSGPLPGQTSLVQSPMFQSAAGPSLEMGSRTVTLAAASQVQALGSVFANPKFDTCFLQYRTSLAQAAAAGTTVAIQPVTLPAPQGVRSYGVVTTYTVPGAGTQVVGDAYVLGGRVVSTIQPSTNGAAIPSSVFTPAYDAVVGRVAANLSK